MIYARSYCRCYARCEPGYYRLRQYADTLYCRRRQPLTFTFRHYVATPHIYASYAAEILLRDAEIRYYASHITLTPLLTIRDADA